MSDVSITSLDPYVVGVVLGMAIVTVVAKVGGLWLLSQVEVSDRLEAGIAVLPGAIVVAILGPELAAGGPVEWTAAGATGLIMWRTGSILAALCGGLATLVVLRSLLPI